MDSVPASIDTNILLRHFLDDHDDFSPRASALMLAVRRGQTTIYCPDTVIFEAIHILVGQRNRKRLEVAGALTDLVSLPSFLMRDEGVVLDALSFWSEQSPLDFADCYHLALTKSLGIPRIYTFDKKMNRYPGVERVEP